MTEMPKIYTGIANGYGSKLLEVTKTNEAFGSDKAKIKFLETADENKDNIIDEVEAKEAVRVLNNYLRPQVKTLTEDQLKSVIEELQAPYKTAAKPVLGLEKIGRVFELNSNGKTFQLVVVEKDKLDALNVDLQQVFANQDHTDFDLKRQIVTNADLAQQIVLGETIENKLPQLKGKLGLFSMGHHDDEGAMPDVRRVIRNSGLGKFLEIEGGLSVYLLTSKNKPVRRGTSLVKLSDLRELNKGVMPSSKGRSSTTAVIFAIEKE
jgi:hypothetical protein